jgi:hypothetical protein
MGSNDFPAIFPHMVAQFLANLTDTRAKAWSLLHPEFLAALRETEDDMGSPDGFSPKSERKREAGGVTGPFSSIRIEKKGTEGVPGEMAGDALNLALCSYKPRESANMELSRFGV